MELDDVWCPTCNRRIDPKRYNIRVEMPPPSHTPARRALKHYTYLTVAWPEPLGLYCSKECEELDVKASLISIEKSIEKEGLMSPLVSSEPSATSASLGAAHGQSSSPSHAGDRQYHSPSVRLLAKMYNFPPPPPPALISFEDAIAHRSYYAARTPAANNGLIMVGRYLWKIYSLIKPQIPGHLCIPVEPTKTIPGWNDGSITWRSWLYNVSLSPPIPQVKKRHAIHSQLGDASIPLPGTGILPRENVVMVNRFAKSLICQPNTISHSTIILKQEKPLLPPGAEGRLLVPNVKLMVRIGATASGSTKKNPSFPPPSTGSDSDETATKYGHPQCSVSLSQGPKSSIHSWTYDNIKTYDMMPFPPKKEKCTRISIIGGNAVHVEEVVEVQQPCKRLFLFPAPIRTS